MIEMSLKQYREEYKKLSFPADLKSAGLLVIPNNALFKVQISDAEKDAIIEKGANILRQLSPWLFFRSSWTEYFFLSQQSTNEIEAIIDDLIQHEASLEPIMDLWKKLVLPFDEGPEMFPELIERISWELQKGLDVFDKSLGLMASHDNNEAKQHR